MTERNDAEALETAKGLTGALTSMTGQLQAVASYGRHSRRMIWGVIASLVLDLALTVVVAVFAIQAHDANASAAAAKLIAVVARQNARGLCESGNASRAQQIALWGYLLDQPPAPGSPPRTPAQQARIAAFRAYIAATFKSRDCARLGR